MHPSDRQIAAYAQRTLDPAELLEVDDHLAACDACRTRTAALAGLGEALAELRTELGRPETPVADRRRWVWPASAAAALFLVLIPVALRWRSSALPGLAALPREQQQRVQAALQAGVAEPPTYLSDLAGRPEVLMSLERAPVRPGESVPPLESFRPIAPLGTVTVSDRPAFRWEPLAGSESYTILVSDESLRPVARSAPLSQATWTPHEPLPRGRVYVWQVTARRAAESLTVPAPPAPYARFRVVEEETARALEQLAREHPDAHLVLGILYAQAGVRAEAVAHLSRIEPGDPNYATAQRTMEKLK